MKRKIYIYPLTAGDWRAAGAMHEYTMSIHYTALFFTQAQSRSQSQAEKNGPKIAITRQKNRPKTRSQSLKDDDKMQAVGENSCCF